jgi:uncharacterized protein
MQRIVVSDTTALIHLARISCLDLLRCLYTEIFIPTAVYNEVTHNKFSLPGALTVANASWIKVVAVKNPAIVQKLRAGLDLGESEAIALALEMGADVLIIDEVAGRQRATEYGQRIIGMVGILVAAKKAGLIHLVEPHLDALESTGFHMGQALRNIALTAAGELGAKQGP